MTETTTKTAPSGSTADPMGDPMGDLIAALRGASSVRAKARALASEIAAARAWEQLPPALRQAVRDDAASIVKEERRPGTEGLQAAGYSRGLARRALRDLGRA
jgi:hypothetical protein